MLQKANIHQRYRSWLRMVALFCIGVTLWLLYDGAIAYPRQRVRAEKYLEFKEAGEAARAEEHVNENVVTEADMKWKTEWEEYAKSQGWATRDPGEPKTPTYSAFQFILAVFLGIPGLICALMFFRTRNRWIEMDDDGFGSSWGQELKFEEITSLDKKKWEKKGIAKVSYNRDGRKGTLVLDDWKFDTDETKAMVREIEARIGVDKIVNGAPEPPPEEKQEDAPPVGEQPAEQQADEQEPAEDQATEDEPAEDRKTP